MYQYKQSYMPFSEAKKYSDMVNIVKSENFCEADILKIINRDCLATVVKGYYDSELCKLMSDTIKNMEDITSYEAAKSINKWGMAIFETAGRPEKLFDYYDSAQEALKHMRNVCSPNLSPSDQMRLDLQEIWGAGSNLENFHGRKVFTGLCRLFKKGSEALPHQDMVKWDIPDSTSAHSLFTQLALNVYIEPAEGGELELWNYGFKTEKEYKDHSLLNSYGLDRELIASSSTIIKPETGDLIIFDAQKIHAVRKVTLSKRITVSSFVGYRGPTQPLCFFS